MYSQPHHLLLIPGQPIVHISVLSSHPRVVSAFCGVFQAGGEAAVADLGGSIITGVHSNPLAVLARQLRIPLHDISGDVPLYLRDGSELGTKVDKQVRLALIKQGGCNTLRLPIVPLPLPEDWISWSGAAAG